MITRRPLLLLLLAAGPALADDPRQRVALLFRDRLAPFGRWTELGGLGPAWVPDVPASWRPFGVGSWAWTEEAGWLWQGGTALSRITEHRGRWRRQDGHWLWLPGARFEPAPVAWGRAPERLGWAALPPNGEPAQGWSIVPLAEMGRPRDGSEAAGSPDGLRRTAPPAIDEVLAAGGAPATVALADAIDADDLRSWRLERNRSGRSIGGLPPLRPSPGVPATGPTAPDQRWQAQERQRQIELEASRQVLERDRQRVRENLR